jgi:hypothetical protein
MGLIRFSMLIVRKGDLELSAVDRLDAKPSLETRGSLRGHFIR